VLPLHHGTDWYSVMGGKGNDRLLKKQEKMTLHFYQFPGAAYGRV